VLNHFKSGVKEVETNIEGASVEKDVWINVKKSERSGNNNS